MLIKSVRDTLVRHFVHVSWQGIFIFLAIYSGITWVGFSIAGEVELTKPVNFLYFIITSISTVGYGDISPGTDEGKIFSSLFVTPLGVAIFAFVIGKGAITLSDFSRRGIRGLKQINKTDHDLVIGWNDRRTINLLELLIEENADQARDIVLVVAADIDNPMPDKIDMRKVDDFIHSENLDLANIGKAHSIIIDTPSDEVTLACGLLCESMNKEANIIAYFQNEALSDLLAKQSEKIECTPSVSVEMLAKAATDPGSSIFTQHLLSPKHSGTQYSLKVPSSLDPIKVKGLFFYLKTKRNATLAGIKKPDGSFDINPDLDNEVEPLSTIYYLASKRIKTLNWDNIHS
jgi:voltage-gated potassium channel